MNPKVAIIMLNWNGWEDTVECLESLYQITYPNYDVIVVDNRSEDESIEKIKEYAEGKIKVESKFFEYNQENKPIKIAEYTREEAEAGGCKEKEIADLPSNKKLILIKNEKNYMFAEGNNIGMRYALKALNPDYSLLLNNDTVVHRDFLGELAKTMQSDEKIGVVGSTIYDYDINGRSDVVRFEGGKLNWWKYPVYTSIPSVSPTGATECDWISGAAMMIRLKHIPIKFLNTEFFFGCEDVDLCIRLGKLGYKMVAVSDSKIWHKGSVSRNKRYSRIRQQVAGTKCQLKLVRIHNKGYVLLFILYSPQIIVRLFIRALRILSK